MLGAQVLVLGPVLLVSQLLGMLYSKVIGALSLLGASAGMCDFCRYRLVMAALSSTDTYTRVPYVSLLSVADVTAVEPKSNVTFDVAAAQAVSGKMAAPIPQSL